MRSDESTDRFIASLLAELPPGDIACVCIDQWNHVCISVRIAASAQGFSPSAYDAIDDDDDWTCV